MNRRGMVDDAIVWLGLFSLAGISTIIVFLIMSGLNDGIQNSSHFDAQQKSFMSGYLSDYATVWDFTILTVFVAGMIGLLILTFVLRANPGIFFAVWFVLILITIVAAAISNGFEFAFQDANLSASSSQFPITSHLLSNLVPYMVGSLLLMLLVFFGGGDR